MPKALFEWLEDDGADRQCRVRQLCGLYKRTEWLWICDSIFVHAFIPAAILFHPCSKPQISQTQTVRHVCCFICYLKQTDDTTASPNGTRHDVNKCYMNGTACLPCWKIFFRRTKRESCGGTLDIESLGPRHGTPFSLVHWKRQHGSLLIFLTVSDSDQLENGGM